VPTCIHDLEQSSCSLCSQSRGIAQFLPADWDRLADLAFRAATDQLGVWIESRYNGTCRGCGDRWEPGELIRYDDAAGGWVCALCGQEEP
jgi:hypothetical protein